MAQTEAWLAQCERWRKQYPLKYPKKGGLRAQHVLDRLDALTEGRTVITSDVGQHQMWAAQFCRTREGRRWITTGGAGTMGFGFPAAIGAWFARPEEEIWAVVGDGGFQMTLCELATAAVHRVPVKILVINNNYLGMVRQWQDHYYAGNKQSVRMFQPDFIKIAEAMGINGIRVSDKAQVDASIEAALAHPGAVLLDFEVEDVEDCYPMMPPGVSLSQTIDQPKVEQPARQPERVR